MFRVLLVWARSLSKSIAPTRRSGGMMGRPQRSTRRRAPGLQQRLLHLELPVQAQFKLIQSLEPLELQVLAELKLLQRLELDLLLGRALLQHIPLRRARRPHQSQHIQKQPIQPSPSQLHPSQRSPTCHSQFSP